MWLRIQILASYHICMYLKMAKVVPFCTFSVVSYYQWSLDCPWTHMKFVAGFWKWSTRLTDIPHAFNSPKKWSSWPYPDWLEHFLGPWRENQGKLYFSLFHVHRFRYWTFPTWPWCCCDSCDPSLLDRVQLRYWRHSSNDDVLKHSELRDWIV